MRFLLGRKTLLIINKGGVRFHRAPSGQHFEVRNLKGKDLHVLVPDPIERLKELAKMAEDAADSVESMTDKIAQGVQHAAANQLAMQALSFHRDRTEDLLKRVLRSKDSSEASELVAEEIKITEERMAERIKI